MKKAQAVTEPSNGAVAEAIINGTLATTLQEPTGAPPAEKTSEVAVPLHGVSLNVPGMDSAEFNMLNAKVTALTDQVAKVTEQTTKVDKRLDQQLTTLFQMAEKLMKPAITRVDVEDVSCCKVPYQVLSAEQKVALARPLPVEAIQEGNSHTNGRNTIKAPYLFDRLDEVFGVCGCDYILSSEYVCTVSKDLKDKRGNMVVMKAHLDMPAYNIHLESYGGNNNIDAGDAYKGATTDAFTKMCSQLGIGRDVFKGLGYGPSEAYERSLQEEGNTDLQPCALPVIAPEPLPQPVVMPEVVAPVTLAEEPAVSDSRSIGVICEDCKQLVTGTIVKGVTYAAEQVLKRSQERWQLNICSVCLIKRKPKADTSNGLRVN